MRQRKRPVYLDYQATTPVDPRVIVEMMPYLTEVYGNASSKENEYGWAADAGVEVARERVARLIGAEPEEIYFTSGATESANLALQGIVRASRQTKVHLITTQIEHPCVLETIRYLERCGADVTYLSVNRMGRIDLKEFEDSIRAETLCAAIMHANNEIGTLQDIARIGEICRQNGLILFSDIVQSLTTQQIDARKMGIQLAPLSAHKIYGPKGVGALYVSRKDPRVKISPILFGGAQEKGLRSGTLNVPAIVGFGKAAEVLIQDRKIEIERMSRYRERFLKRLKMASVKINGDPEHCLPHSVSFTVPEVAGESLIMATRELAYSSGSACASAKIEPSHVLKAIGLTEQEARSTVRVSFGRFTQEEDVDFAAEILVDSISKLIRLSTDAGTQAPSNELRP